MADGIDKDEVATLLDSIERDLGGLTADQPKLAALRDELHSLRELLQSPEHGHHRVREALHGLRAALDEALEHAKAEGFTVGSYIAQIGRMLGL